MANIDPSFIPEIKQRCDIVALIGTRVQYRKTSSGKSWACCPFHAEKTPSFAVDAREQFYHCFGCKKSGDALRFLMDHDNLDFVEAVEALARFCGVEVRYTETQVAPQEIRARKQRLDFGVEALAAAADFYHAAFYQESAQAARLYLHSRDVTPELVKRFALGYAPRGNALKEALQPRFSEALLIDCGLLRQAQDGQTQDFFYDRLMFPIHNLHGQVVAFGARALGNAQPKYLNSQESDWFNKRHELYGLHLAQKNRAKHLIVTEGYMDVVKLHQHGFDNAVASLGTAVGETHIAQLKKRCKKATFCFDGDTAGHTAAEKALEAIFNHYDEGTEWRFAFLPAGEDPDSLLEKEGREGMHRVLDASRTPSQFLLKLLGVGDARPKTLEEQSHTARRAAEWLGRLPAGSYRDLLQKELQSALQVSVHITNAAEEKSVSFLPRVPRQQSGAPARGEWRLLALLAENPEWAMDTTWQALLPSLDEKMPRLHEFFYLIQAGAEKALLHAQLAAWQLTDAIAHAEEALAPLDAGARRAEFLSAGARLFAAEENYRARLEKMG